MKMFIFSILFVFSNLSWAGLTFDIYEEVTNYTADFSSLTHLWVDSLNSKIRQKCGTSSRGHIVKNIRLDIKANQGMFEVPHYSTEGTLILHYPKVIIAARVTCR